MTLDTDSHALAGAGAGHVDERQVESYRPAVKTTRTRWRWAATTFSAVSNEGLQDVR
jgi:hypothetical protein